MPECSRRIGGRGGEHARQEEKKEREQGKRQKDKKRTKEGGRKERSVDAGTSWEENTLVPDGYKDREEGHQSSPSKGVRKSYQQNKQKPSSKRKTRVVLIKLYI